MITSPSLLARRIGLGIFAGVVLAGAAPFEFVPAPQTDLNRIYRIDRVTGEVSACQYGLKEGTIGVTFCYPAGEGASKQTPGEYGLVASHHEREGGVFRVNYRTGEMSVCYVFNEQVVCTPQATTSAAQPTAPLSGPTEGQSPH
ncbi:hypothetical protein ACFQU1_21415 [Chelatococcus sp. GCM10030263]|uniref:hypothetical protein n=1 Tax=Chelatococcus sp. GCM10030263 TaxID=3273387 RepID=UPI00361D69C2